MLDANGAIFGTLNAGLQSAPPVFGFPDSAPLASLCTCAGISMEMGTKLDRLSPFLGVEAPDHSTWQFQILENKLQFELRVSRADGSPIIPRHHDLMHLFGFEFAPTSEYPTAAVLKPRDVAEYFKTQGFNLVVVRDWFISALLSDSPVGYLETNMWEIENRNATVQADLMVQRQLAFTGTHDIVDHLLGASATQFSKHSQLFIDVKKTLTTHFNNDNWQEGAKPIMSYLIGVLLDDLAQPKWYGSTNHAFVIQLAEGALSAPDIANLNHSMTHIPPRFHSLVALVRRTGADSQELLTEFGHFLTTL